MENFYLSVAPIIEEVGVELAKNFGKAEVIAQKTESPGDVVTELDRKTEKTVAERLHKLYPSIEFFGEEFGGNDKAKRFWILDPIDGTALFVRGIPWCTTQIALVENGRIVFSIIYNFVTKEMFSAQIGMGAKRNGKSISVSKRSGKNSCITFETHREKKENLDRFINVGNHCGIISTHNTGFEFCLVASGKIEARLVIDGFGQDWDYAPGSLLVSEAGGIVRNIGSDTYDYRNHNFIAGNREVHEELKNIVEK
jgi:myo-inositol-1(or 4)-monophosphatase